MITAHQAPQLLSVLLAHEFTEFVFMNPETPSDRTRRSRSWTRRVRAWLLNRLPAQIVGNLSQRFRGAVHEPDFELFSGYANQRLLFVDVGANRGHSALSLLNRTRRWRVLSLEPNRKLRWGLLLVWLMYPLRFRFRLLGAGEGRGTIELLVPRTTGADISTNASFVRSEFDKDYVRERLTRESAVASGAYRIRPQQARVVPLDDLALPADVIKLDVEGFELAALRGMEETIRRRRPVLMIEMNNQHEWLPLLRDWGYGFYRYDGVRSRLLPIGEDETWLNVFCVPQGGGSRPATASGFADLLRSRIGAETS